ncbi:MAG: type II toxin-antitoxin system RelE/ParE family toxin [Acidiferrobacterales bacterium]
MCNFVIDNGTGVLYTPRCMEIEFEDDDLDRLEVDRWYDAGLPQGVAKAFRKRLQQIRAAPDERDFYALRSLRFEKLKGKRKGEYSMRLNNQYRLILRFKEKDENKVVIIVSIEDYH